MDPARHDRKQPHQAAGKKGAILNRWEEDGPEGDWVH
tara:strand:+ start:228 stop:338 length:111 start_codon:yes stop_codon:yes gene_type:complete